MDGEVLVLVLASPLAVDELEPAGVMFTGEARATSGRLAAGAVVLLLGCGVNRSHRAMLIVGQVRPAWVVGVEGTLPNRHVDQVGTAGGP